MSCNGKAVSCHRTPKGHSTEPLSPIPRNTRYIFHMKFILRRQRVKRIIWFMKMSAQRPTLRTLWWKTPRPVRYAAGFCILTIPLIWSGWAVATAQWRTAVENQLEQENNAFVKQAEIALDIAIKARLKATTEAGRSLLSVYQEKVTRKDMSEASAQQTARTLVESCKIGKNGKLIALPASTLAKQYPQIKRQLMRLAEDEPASNSPALKQGYVPSFDMKDGTDGTTRQMALYAICFKEWEWTVAAFAPYDELIDMAEDDFLDKDVLAAADPTTPSRPLHYLLDATGSILTHPAWGKMPSDGKDAKGFSFLAAMVKKKNGQTEYALPAVGKSAISYKMAVHAEIPGPGWIAVSEADMGRFRQKRNASAGLAFGLTVLVLGCSLPTARALLNWRANRVRERQEAWDSAVASAAKTDATRFRAEKEQLKQELFTASKDRDRYKAKNHELTDTLDNMRKESDEITHLNSMVEKLQACDSEEEMCSILKRQAALLFPEDSGAFYEYHESQRTLELVLEWGEPSLTLPPFCKEFVREDCWGLRRGKAHVHEDPRSEESCRHLASGPYASICHPITAHGDELLGLLCLRINHPIHASGGLDASDILHTKQGRVTNVAEQFGMALSNLKLREALRTQSIRDQLTGLYNRRHMEESFMRELHRAQRQNQPLGLIMCDIDHFKKINDTYGHDKGDEVLRGAAAVLQKNIRQGDIACRYGGEEFLIIMPEASLEITAMRAEQIRQSIRQKTLLPQQAITLSLGVAMYPNDGQSTDELQAAADAALYEAKRTGRDRVVISSAGA
ncbi:TPA: hypothetical protein DDW35_03000 [Candidatus Sumerlaeota bacterium]|nr:hypothetical protein [Candidatus Sumerlaeota bacterium]